MDGRALEGVLVVALEQAVAAAVDVDMVPVPDFAFGEFPMMLHRLITVLQKNEDFLAGLPLETTRRADCLNEFFYRGLLAHFDELRFHAFVRMHIYFYLFHV